MRRRHGLPALVLAATVVAACSGSDQAADTTAAPTSAIDTTTSAATADTGSTESPTTAPPSTAPATTVPLATGMVTFTKAVDGLTKPVDIAYRDGVNALYVAQQDGKVVRLVDGKVADTVLDISGKISTDNEQGLLGLAFHPTAKLVYIDYTDAAGDTVVAELPVRPDGTFDATAERPVLKVDQPFPNHNGGELVFGPDGMLYIGLGDGGAANDPNRNALNLDSPLGKILRIDPISWGGRAYHVPDDNPFVGRGGSAELVWAYGLRNPWRFDFDSATGDLWIGDVGQNQWEEVDVATSASGGGKGANFGWSAMEGNHRFNEDQDPDGAIPPIWEYEHGDAGCSVSGGTVYRGTEVPSLVGAYVVADYCSGKVWALQPSADFTTANVVPLGEVANPSAVVDGPDGELWVLAHGEGALYRLSPA